MSIPPRCRACAHWLGHKSGNDEDTRCNRSWGHEVRYGDFWSSDFADEAYGHPARVTPNCRVPRFGIPFPPMDENGNPCGPRPTPELVDAFIPRSFPYLRLRRGSYDLLLTPSELQDYLMALDKDALAKRFQSRTAERKSLQKNHYDTYQKMYGTMPGVLEGSKDLPPYMRGEERIPTGILQLDLATGGGLPPGLRFNISGSPDSGKSSFMNLWEGALLKHYRRRSFAFGLELAENQKLKGKDAIAFAEEQMQSEKIAMIKPEQFSLEYMVTSMHLASTYEEAIEIFNQHVEIIDTNFLEESAEYMITHVNHDNLDLSEYRGPETNSWMLPLKYRHVSIDSIDADELAEERFGKNMQEKKMGEDSRLGTQARVLAEFFRKTYKAAKLPLPMSMISQYRADINRYGGGKKVHRGNAHPYFTNFEANFYKPNSQDDEFVHEVKCRFGKVHIPASVKEGDEIDMYLKIGAGYVPELNTLKTALDHPDVEILQKSGSWTKYQDPKTEEVTTLGQGTNPAKVKEMLEAKGIGVTGLYQQIMEAQGYGAYLTPSIEEQKASYLG